MNAPGSPRRVVIADDEPLSRERLSMLLAAHPDWIIVAECENGTQAIEAIGRDAPDLVLLDIRMPELTGIEVAQALEGIREAGLHVPAIVFVTAHEDHALQAFDVQALDYLLKPVDQARLDRALERVGERLANVPRPPEPRLNEFLRALSPGPIHPPRFLVRDPRGGFYFVRVDEIDWIEASGNYVTLHAGGGTHLVRDTMNEFMEKLDPALFVRVHRSAIVHLDRIVRIEPAERGEYRIKLRDGTELNTSRAHSERLRALLQS